MNAKQELMECSPALRDVMGSLTVWMEPPWLDSPGAFVRVHSWREASFDLEIQPVANTPAS